MNFVSKISSKFTEPLIEALLCTQYVHKEKFQAIPHGNNKL